MVERIIYAACYISILLNHTCYLNCFVEIVDESTEVLKKTERKYRGHMFLSSKTRKLLSTIQREDVTYRYLKKNSDQPTNSSGE
ncbi:hypothetical protein YC2023_062123 [Brassica napus]